MNIYVSFMRNIHYPCYLKYTRRNRSTNINRTMHTKHKHTLWECLCKAATPTFPYDTLFASAFHKIYSGGTDGRPSSEGLGVPKSTPSDAGELSASIISWNSCCFMQTQHLNVGTASTRSILLHRKHTSVWHTSHRTVPRVSHGAACCALHPQGKCWGRLVFANWFSVAAAVLAVAAMTACTVVAAAACLQGSATSTCGQVGRADLGLKDVPAVLGGDVRRARRRGSLLPGRPRTCRARGCPPCSAAMAAVAPSLLPGRRRGAWAGGVLRRACSARRPPRCSVPPWRLLHGGSSMAAAVPRCMAAATMLAGTSQLHPGHITPSPSSSVLRMTSS